MRNEQERLRAFILTVLEYVNIPMFDSAVEPIRNCNLASGLRMAMNDTVELCEDLKPEQVVELDALLSAKQLPTLTQMTDRRYVEMKKILQRNRIRSDDEWRMIEGYMGALDTKCLSAEERDRAMRLLADYENRV